MARYLFSSSFLFTFLLASSNSSYSSFSLGVFGQKLLLPAQFGHLALLNQTPRRGLLKLAVSFPRSSATVSVWLLQPNAGHRATCRKIR
ncbi:hypothetical protein BDP67DRAFT_70468 [Colletotrichum lupini]|nr:hypothetical protein BDP67DRAFT_70468 [Colletotrichum lupini]